MAVGGVIVDSKKSFRTKVIEHMEWYKINKLGIKESGLYYGKDGYGHILPNELEDCNIIDPYRGDLKTSSYLKDMKRHVHFNHLNSSQAMCINFFYPLIKERQLEALLDVFGFKGQVDYSSVTFEKESDLEKEPNKKTTFDFYMSTEAGLNFYFEIKYTENDFGKENNDQEHRTKFNNTYEPILNNNRAISDQFKEEESFLSHYQILRNLIHIDDRNYVVFIYPKENQKINRAANHSKYMILKPEWKDHLILLTWEELNNCISWNVNSKELGMYYEEEFSEKYLKLKESNLVFDSF